MKTIIIATIVILIILSAGCIEEKKVVTEADLKAALSATQEYGTYENPTPLNSILTSSTDALDICVAVTVRGEKVNIMAQKENRFNNKPKVGNEYLLIAMIVKYNKMDHLDNDDKFLLSSFDFSAYVNNVECDRPSLVLPNEFDTSLTNMMPDSISRVWLIFEVPKDSKVTISYDRLFVTDSYYFDAGTEDFNFKKV